MTLTHDARFTLEKIRRRLELLSPLIHRRSVPLAPFRFRTLDDPLTPPPLEEDDSSWELIPHNSYWGAKNLNFALSGSFTIPPDFDAHMPVMLSLPLGAGGDFSHPEALIYVDGEPYAACDRQHHEVLLRDSWRDGQPHRLLLHGWCGLLGSAGAGAKLLMKQPAIGQVDMALREFLAVARVAYGVAAHSAAANTARDRLLNALDEAFRHVDLREPFGDALYASIPAAHAVLQRGLETAGAPLDVSIHATGHAHIDTAWLWTVAQTRRKAERTFSTVLRLMEEFPEYRFVQSQPQLYDFIRQDQPAIFEQIQQRIAEGRWEPIGGMWVESDCNIPGGESLVRQFMLGRRFFRDHFGERAESPVLWLPDVFGYAWNLPQLIKQAGLEYFFTIKIGWNQFNRLPYDTFWWQGLDGTRVLTHFSTSPEAHDIHSHGTYNVEADGMTALGTWLNVQQRHVVRDILMSYGHGDGGGGPTREMIENIRALACTPGAPVVRQSRVIDFFRHVEAVSGAQLPVWNGELYLEIHRGTYTTQARNKRGNRQSEFLLHDAEFAATAASLLDKAYAYPHEALRKAWELVCLNQFHDIIPGSSIGEVYVDSQRDYAEVRRIAESVRDAALSVIAAHVGAEHLVVNPSGTPRREVVMLPAELAEGQAIALDGAALPSMPVSGGTLFEAELPPFSIQPLALLSSASPSAPGDLSVSPRHLENERLRVELNEAGDIVRLYDKQAGREVLPPGGLANQFIAYEDRPVNWDAWDIDIFHDDKWWLADPAESIEVVEAGPLRAALEIRRRILNSPYVQRISLDAAGDTLVFDTRIDWRERHVLLKAAFPVDVLSPVATFEVQFGSVQRPTHTNTSWDWARFESAAQKWVYLGESDFGVGLLNDCKYGHRVHENVMYLSLLRGPTSPDPTADLGTHEFRCALYINRSAETALRGTSDRAYQLNNPAFVYTAGDAPKADAARSLAPLVTASAPHVRIETVKRAEDGRGLIIRGYEFERRRGAVTFTFGFDIAAAAQTTILEVDGEALPVEGSRSVTLHVRPFQVFTLRVIPADEA